MPQDLPLEISCQEVRAQQQSGGNALLVDCREPEEHAIAAIEGARLVPMGEIPDRLSELEAYRNRPIAVHCHHGGRSLRVARWLREQGFSQAQSMAGGIDQWSQEIDSSVPRY
jgi:rhodanese-related sulfurtransferase